MLGATTTFHVKILNHPIERTIYQWMFQVSGMCASIPQTRPFHCLPGWTWSWKEYLLSQVNRVMKWWKQMMQKSANSLGTKVQPTDLCIFKNTLGNLCFFQATLPFPKSKGFFWGQKTGGPARFQGKNGYNVPPYHPKKIDSQVSYLWKLYQTNRWRDISPQVQGIFRSHNSCGTFFFGGGASMVMSD